MPTSVNERKKHSIELMQCKSPTSSPHASDVHDDGAIALSSDLDAIDALMGLSLSMTDIGVYEYAL